MGIAVAFALHACCLMAQAPPVSLADMTLKTGTHTIEVWAYFDNCGTMFRSALSGSPTEEAARRSGTNYPDEGKIRALLNAKGARLVKKSNAGGQPSDDRIVSATIKTGDTYYWRSGKALVTYKLGGGGDAPAVGGDSLKMTVKKGVANIFVQNLLPDLEKAKAFFGDMPGATGIKGMGSGAATVGQFASVQHDAVERVRKIRDFLKTNTALTDRNSQVLQSLIDDATSSVAASVQRYNDMPAPFKNLYLKKYGSKYDPRTLLLSFSRMAADKEEGRLLSEAAQKIGAIQQAAEAPDDWQIRQPAVINGVAVGFKTSDGPGIVRSPFGRQRKTNVTGVPPGAKVKCPETGKVFLVP